jgi:4'-phosphopantetheinyl transferase
MKKLEWLKAPEALHAGRGEVHIWECLLDPDDETAEALFSILSDRERERALQFHFDRLRRRYVVAHGLLRSILGMYLDVEPKLLVFCTNPCGKPYLCPDRNDESIMFNISHSDDLSVIALSSELEVGIDIERTNRELNVAEIAGSFFSKKEIEKLSALTGDPQREAFFRCWTRKEAYLKGKGRGLSMALSRFEVSLLPHEPPSVLADDDCPEDVHRWRLYDMPPLPGYIGALSVEAGIETIKHFSAASLLASRSPVILLQKASHIPCSAVL